MESLEAELDRARALDIEALADAIESIGFECTRCGACCKGVDGCDGAGAETDQSAEGPDTGGCEADDAGDEDGHDHVATVFPDEVRGLQATAADAGETVDWRDVARPMPYGLDAGSDGTAGDTFEWALQVDDCGDCTFYEEGEIGHCTVHADRPLVCRTYPFSVALGGTSQPMGEAVDTEGMVRAHECEGLGRDISRREAERLAETLKRRAVRELEEAIAVRDEYRHVETEGVVVHDSEGAKRADGTPID
jgi:Fe-S-cluster containining protein